jgi:hypothetical protein
MRSANEGYGKAAVVVVGGSGCAYGNRFSAFDVCGRICNIQA